jgi:fatty-acyl-CoA synthase
VSCPGHEIRIVDESGAAVAERMVGDIEARGPSVMREYYRDPVRTHDTLPGGWLRTGDTGYLAAGELYVCGRRKDLIIAHGTNVYPQDLEWIAGDVPGIRHGRVIAFGTTGSPQRIVMLVELVNAAVNATDVSSAIRRRIGAAYGIQLDEVRAVPAGTIAFTTSGKPRRAHARALYESGALSPDEGPA